MQTTQCAADKYLDILYKSMQLKYMTLHTKTNHVFAVQLFSWNHKNKLLQVQWEILIEDVERMYKVLQNAMARPLETWGGQYCNALVANGHKTLEKKKQQKGRECKRAEEEEEKAEAAAASNKNIQGDSSTASRLVLGNTQLSGIH